MTVVTMECAGVIEGEKSLEILNHVEAGWARGQAVVALLRAELPAEAVETLAPLRNGGVHLQKLFGVMHDTCHAANKVIPTPVKNAMPLKLYLNPNPTHSSNTRWRV